MRDFLRNPKSVLPPPNEGLKVTRRDCDAFYIYPDVRQMSDKIMPLSDKKEGMSDNTSDNLNGGELEKKIDKELNINNLPMGWCQLHFEKGVKYPLKEITYEDENGNVVFEKKSACPKCVEKYEKIGRGKVYYL